MKRFIIVYIIIFCFGCKKDNIYNGNNYYVEHYRLINPNNLLYNCKGDLILDYSESQYTLFYDFTCIDKKDTVNFHFSESGKFSETYKMVTYQTPFNEQGYYFSGKLIFSPYQDLLLSWGCTYQLSDSAGFGFTFLNPTPHLITYLPVYDQKMVIHTIDSVLPGVIKPWMEIFPIESGICDTMQLFWL